MKEKYNFVYNNEKSYDFPKRIVKLEHRSNQPNFGDLSKVKQGRTCVASHVEEVCINQPVCRVVCTAAGAGIGAAAGGGVGTAVGIGVGTQICKELCNLVPKCSNTTVCDEWQEPIHNIGQDSNGNWRSKYINLGE